MPRWGEGLTRPGWHGVPLWKAPWKSSYLKGKYVMHSLLETSFKSCSKSSRFSYKTYRGFQLATLRPPHF